MSDGLFQPAGASAHGAAQIQVDPVHGIGEIAEGDDLADVLCDLLEGALGDGDVVVVTSKVVSKAEGRVVAVDRDTALAQETDRVVARRGATSIVRTHHGLVMAAAGIDGSNTAVGTAVLLPVDPDASARRLRAALVAATGHNVAVLVTDTSGRAWRDGQTDIAVGAAGLRVLEPYAGRTDDYGNPLVVTAPAVADEIAGAADLVKGKLTRCPAAVVRGLHDLVLPLGEDGPGAAALIRPEAADMFGLGAREAVLIAVTAGATDVSPDARPLRGFGGPAPFEQLSGALLDWSVDAPVRGADDALEVVLSAPSARELGRQEARVLAVAAAHGWVCASGADVPGETEEADTRTVLRFLPTPP